MSAMPSVTAKPSDAYDVVVSVRALPACTCCTGCAAGMTARVFEQGSARRRHVVLEPLPRRALRRREHAVLLFVLGRAAAGMGLERAPRAAAGVLKYANHVADRFNLRPDIQFNTRSKAPRSTKQAGVVDLDIRRQDSGAKFVVLATGCLSNARMPDIKGLGQFKGKVYHTGHWPHEAVDFTGQHVGVIGTGSSAIQSVPVIAEQASQLTVFQRTANFSIPARNAALSEQERERFRANYPRSGVLRAR